jgi:predicted O-linked N-acetylglucosamine transferase (SPINDLY family)
MGHTLGAPTSVFAQRAAPVQVEWLGFPGSSGAPYMDYIIADRTVIPDDQESCYSEKIAWLPHSCFPTDNKRALPQAPSRQDAGLPDGGFIFCNFGKPLKFAPDVFAAWMRLLKEIPDSILWLAHCESETAGNLQRSAEAHGVDGGRIRFAPFLDSPDEHLARIGLADLYLDTFPYNAHATACEFLWAGVPVLTLCGGGYAGRAGASILMAAGLDTLITHSLGDYEQRALQLAKDDVELRSIKDALARNRNLWPLFDTARFTRNLERTYTELWKRYQAREMGKSFVVADYGAMS